VEVELPSKEGVISVPWVNIRKRIHVGDFVEVTGGGNQGQTGWVDHQGKIGVEFDEKYDLVQIVGLPHEGVPLVCGSVFRKSLFLLYSDFHGTHQPIETYHPTLPLWKNASSFRWCSAV
jgi:hypothetical protein